MSINSQGLGRDTDVVGGYVAFGMGIVGLLPVVNVAISFVTNVDVNIAKQLNASKDISFNLDLLFSILNQLEANPNAQFDLETSIEVATRDNIFNPEIVFNANLDVEFAKQLVTSAGITLDVELTQQEASFLIQFILERQNVYLISEELRFLPIFKEQRLCAIEEDNRNETIKYESRVVVVPQKGD